MRFWLFKTEPGCFSLDDLECSPGKTTPWDGVRNFQARNFMQDMRKGDRGFFYHSGKNPAIAGIVSVVREAYPDFTALDPRNNHFDPRHTEEHPVWFMVDVRLDRRLPVPLPLSEIKKIPGLDGMELLRRGSRLSVQPVSEEHFSIILNRIG